MNVVLNDFVANAGAGNFDEVPPIHKTFEWRTDVVTFDGTPKEQRNQIFERPRRRWFINWPIVELASRHKIVELFHRAKGRYNTFLYKDRHDYACALTECSVTAVGGETTTQLIKTYYPGETEEWNENKIDIMPSSVFAPIIKIDAAVKTEGTHFTLSDTTGIINWAGGTSPNGALGAGEVVTANYQFYFRVRFDMDIYEDLQGSYEFFQSNPMLIEVIP